MTTRDEFEDLLYDHRQASSGIYDENSLRRSQKRKETAELETALLVVYDTQATRISELEKMCEKLANEGEVHPANQ